MGKLAPNPLRFVLGALATLPLLGLCAPGCETYDSPPRPSIVGLVDGTLLDPAAPLVIRFSEPIDPDSLKVKVVKLVVDEEGRLADEDDDDATLNDEFFGYDPATANIFGGTGELSKDNTTFTIRLNTSLPIGPSLAVLIEPGLKDDAGADWAVRQRLVFGYKLACDESTAGTDKFPSGAYYFLVDVEKPIETQIQLFADIVVDPSTGRFTAQFTNADRNPDPGRCSPACSETEACRLLPAEECVVPSTKAGSADEYPDFLPNDVLPVGYTFSAEGCVVESGEGVVFVNLPTDVDIQQPDVFVQGIQLTASFADDGSGVFRGTGSVTAEKVFIGPKDSGAASGTTTARLIPEGEVPPGIPPAPSP